MEQQQIEIRVIDSFTTQLGFSKGNVTLESNRESLDMDSLDDVEVIMFLEEQFDIEIHDEEAEKLRTVQDVVSLVMSKRTN